MRANATPLSLQVISIKPIAPGNIEVSSEQARVANHISEKPRSADGRQTHRCRSRATLTADDQRAYGETWVNDLQLRLMRLSRRGKRLIVADSGHDMPAERPDAIVAAVRELCICQTHS